MWLCPCVPVALASAAYASPYVAYIGNVPVHSPSPESKIMVVDVADGQAVDVSGGLSSARSPAWSPDGSLVAFEAIEETLNDIFVCRVDGSERRNVTETPDVWESAPAFLDETRIVYLVGPDRSRLTIHDLDSGERSQLTEEALFYGHPVPAPGGALVALFGSEQLGGAGDILIIDVAEKTVRNLTSAPALYSPPCFSPDGETIAFAFDGCEIGGAPRGVATMPVGGGEATLLATDGYPLAPLSFSADGTQIAYTSASCYHSTWVNIVDIAGGNSERIEVSPFHMIGWPSFSPDGPSLAYQGVYGAVYSVNVLDLETGETRRITPNGETGVNPVFSPR